MKPLLSIAILLTLVSCSSSADKRQREFDEVRIGMIKAEVIEVVGPPHWSDHKRGLDRWFYYMKPNKKQNEKIIFFVKGKVYRKGHREKPTLTAEEMEEIKRPRVIYKKHKPSVSKEELRKILKKEIQKDASKPKKTIKYEKL